jgi:hypothetical protein
MKPKTENYKRGLADGYAGKPARPYPMVFKGREEYMDGYGRGVFLKAFNGFLRQPVSAPQTKQLQLF